jgi:Flp pilus assembly protein TadB
MDAPTASIVAAVIGATASIVVAVVTARSKIGAPEPKKISTPRRPAKVPSHPSEQPNYTPSSTPTPPTQEPRPLSARIFRGIGWALVGYLYLSSVAYMFMFVGALATGKSEEVFISLILTVIFLPIALWAQKRLQRKPSPISN